MMEILIDPERQVILIALMDLDLILRPQIHVARRESSEGFSAAYQNGNHDHI